MNIIQYILLMKMGKKYFLYLHHLCLILQILLSVTNNIEVEFEKYEDGYLSSIITDNE